MYYCESDSRMTLILFQHLELQRLGTELNSYRERYDNCDDYCMREKLSREISKIKRQIKVLEGELGISA